MKKLPSIKAILGAIIVICMIQLVSGRLEKLTILSLDSTLTTTGNSFIEALMLKNQRESLNKESEINNVDKVVKQEIEVLSFKASSPVVVYDGMTMEELASKLDRSLSSNLSGYGHAFAKYSIEYGVDPYLAVAITLHETGCKWNCSNLVVSCNNVGGMKGSGCGSYASFNTLEEGIEAMISNLSRNYISQGLTTPETIGTKYAASSTWATKINYYMDTIRNA
ncbi:TPA: glucosaminidase domain-containing protein [Candidatus Ventrenecus stercoripullorum]|nr:glucosaminidase domain-containing protein [Candidatus Ventrenecus stercoripullorum]